MREAFLADAAARFNGEFWRWCDIRAVMEAQAFSFCGFSRGDPRTRLPRAWY